MSFYHVLEKDTLLSQCLSPTRSKTGYQSLVRETWLLGLLHVYVGLPHFTPQASLFKVGTGEFYKESIPKTLELEEYPIEKQKESGKD